MAIKRRKSLRDLLPIFLNASQVDGFDLRDKECRLRRDLPLIHSLGYCDADRNASKHSEHQFVVCSHGFILLGLFLQKALTLEPIS